MRRAIPKIFRALVVAISLACVATLSAQSQKPGDSLVVQSVALRSPTLAKQLGTVAKARGHAPRVRLESARTTGAALRALQTFAADSMLKADTGMATVTDYFLAVTDVTFKSDDLALVTLRVRVPADKKCPVAQYGILVVRDHGPWKSNLVKREELADCRSQM